MTSSELIRSVVTPQRAISVIGGLLGDTVTFGPAPVGPGGMATARATGRIGGLRAAASSATRVAVVVPVDLDLGVEIGRQTVPVQVDLRVRVGLSAGLDPSGDVVVVEVDRLGPGDIDVTSHTRGAAGVMVRRLGDLDNEVRQHVITWVTALLHSPEAHAACRIRVTEADPA